MDTRINIPIRVQRPIDQQSLTAASGNVPEGLHMEDYYDALAAGIRAQPEQAQALPSAGEAHEQPSTIAEGEYSPEVEQWQDRALRLQAEMDNYRKRQQRLAQEVTATERQRILKEWLQIVDNLERALEAPTADGEGLRRGILLTYQAALQLLKKEGVEPIDAVHQEFDPAWHEAVGVARQGSSSVGSNIVVKVVEQGYRLGDRLLRPAKVLVAV